MSFPDRAVASFLGLALGDAFGRTLEFVHGPEVRTQPVPIAPGEFNWTDDSHMSLYLAEAVLEQGPGPLEEGAFGQAVGEAFSRWLDDPLMPYTAPGRTCIEGVRKWRRTHDWQASGVPESDGCGAVMRVVPLGIVYSGEDLDRAATISAKITHGHPNATEAAVATCRLHRVVLEQGRLDIPMVKTVIAGLSPVGDTAAALRSAKREAAKPWEGCLVRIPAIVNGHSGDRERHAHRSDTGAHFLN